MCKIKIKNAYLNIWILDLQLIEVVYVHEDMNLMIEINKKVICSNYNLIMR